LLRETDGLSALAEAPFLTTWGPGMKKIVGVALGVLLLYLFARGFYRGYTGYVNEVEYFELAVQMPVQSTILEGENAIACNARASRDLVSAIGAVRSSDCSQQPGLRSEQRGTPARDRRLQSS
jgi:hypothetical protein